MLYSGAGSPALALDRLGLHLQRAARRELDGKRKRAGVRWRRGTQQVQQHDVQHGGDRQRGRETQPVGAGQAVGIKQRW